MHSCFSSNIHHEEQGSVSLSEADQLLLRRWSNRLLSTYYIQWENITKIYQLFGINLHSYQPSLPAKKDNLLQLCADVFCIDMCTF